MAKKSAKSKTEPVAWNLYEHGISPSGLRSWLRDRESFRLEYREDWGSKWNSLNIEYGNAVHHVLAKCFENGNPQAQPTSQQIANWISEYQKTARENVMPVSSVIEEWERVMGMAAVVMDVYFDRWWEEDCHKDWLFTEKKVTVPLKLSVPIGRSVEVLTVPLNATLDAGYMNVRGVPILFDTKTKSSVKEDNLFDLIDTDIQFNWYMFITSLLEKESGVPLCKDMCLNVVRMPQLKFCAKDKGDLSAYLARVKEHVQEKPDEYFIRITAGWTHKEIRNWADQTLLPMLRDLILWYEGITPHYHNPEGLVFNHMRSPYFEAITKGDFSRLKRGGYWRKYQFK